MYVPSDYEAILEDGIIREQIEAAKAAGSVSGNYVRAVVAAVAEAGNPVTFEEVLENDLWIKRLSPVNLLHR